MGTIPVHELTACACALDSLDRLLAKFNFFVAVGAARNESRHSDFLRVLLTPTESHGLGDRFLKNFLLRALREAPAASPEFRLELARASLQDALVEGEENRIDLLIVNERLRFGVVVENKVATGEHDNQLERYWSVIHSHYPGLVRRFGVLLSPKGVVASHHEYKDFAYGEIGAVLEQSVSAGNGKLDIDATVVLSHYMDLLRSEFMEDAEAAAAAWTIWHEHRGALDFVRRSSPSAQLCGELKRLIDLTPICDYEKIKGRDAPYELAFVLRGWREDPRVGDPSGRSGYKSALLFWFDDFRDQIKLSLGVWQRRAELLKRLTDLPNSEAAFRGHRWHREDEWSVIWSRLFVSRQDLRTKTRDELFDQIRKRWVAFCQKNLAAISSAVFKCLPKEDSRRGLTNIRNR
jgi:hypothetical protein